MESSNETGQIKNVSGNTTQMVQSEAQIQSVPIVLRIKQNQPTPSKEKELKTTLQMRQTNHSVLQTTQTNHPVLMAQSNQPSLQIKQVKQPSVQIRPISQPVLQVGQTNLSVLQTSQTNHPVLRKQLNQPSLQIEQPSVKIKQVNLPAQRVGQVNQQALKVGKRTWLMSQCKQEILQALEFAKGKKQALQMKQCKQQALHISKDNKSAHHIGQVNQSILQTGDIIQPTLSMKSDGQVNQLPLQMCNVNQHTLHMGCFNQLSQQMTNNMSFLNKAIKTEPVEHTTGLDSFSTVVKSEPQEIISTNQNPIPQCVLVSFCKDTVVQPNVENDIKTESSDTPSQQQMETKVTNTADKLDDKNKVLTENVEFTSAIETFNEVKTEPVSLKCLHSSTIDSQTKVENVEYMSIVANNDQIKTEHVEYSCTQTAEAKPEYMETTEQQLNISGIEPCDFVDDSKCQNDYDNTIRIKLETNKSENENISDPHEESGENIGSVDMSTLPVMKPGYSPKACNTSDQDTCTEKIPNLCNVNTDCISKTSDKSVKDTSSRDVHTSSKVSIGYTSTARKSQHKEVSTIHSNQESHLKPLPKIKVIGKIYNESEKQGIEYYTTLSKTLLKSIQTGKLKSAFDQNVLSNFSLSGSYLLKGQGQERPLKITVLAQKSVSNEPNHQAGMTPSTTPSNTSILLRSSPAVIKITPPELTSVTPESSRSVTSVTDQTISPEISTKDTPVDGEACLSVAHESPHSEVIHEQQTSIVEKTPTMRRPISNVFKPQLKLSNSDNLDINNQSKLNMQTTNRHRNSVCNSSSLLQTEDSPNLISFVKLNPQQLTCASQSSINSANQSLSTVKISSKSLEPTMKMDTDLYVCGMCNTAFKTNPELTKHVTICHDTAVPSEKMPRVKLYQCGICNNDKYAFNAYSNLSEHLRSFHPGRHHDPKAKYRRRHLQATRLRIM